MNNKMRGFIDPFTLSLALVIAVVGTTAAYVAHKDDADNLGKSEQPIEIVIIDTNHSVIDQ